MLRCGFAVVALAIAASVAHADGLPNGNWRLSSMSSAANEFPRFTLSTSSKDGKLEVKVLDTPTMRPEKKGDEPRKSEVKISDIKLAGNILSMTVTIDGQVSEFAGTIDPKSPKIVRGSMITNFRASRTVLIQQEAEKLSLPPASERPTMPEPLQTLGRLQNTVGQMMMKARATKDANDKADLEVKIKEMRAELNQKGPALLRETIEKFAESPFAVDAAMNMIRMGAAAKVTATEAASWAKLIQADAAKYGDAYVREANIQLAESLTTQKGMEPLGLSFATKAMELTPEKAADEVRSRTLWAVYNAQIALKKDQEAQSTKAILNKVDGNLDAKYLKTVPPFAVSKLERSNKSANRVAVLELFTGAQCPPCVAADVAFDAIEKAYSSKDVVLLQYHMHIPGPDPLTNLDTIARWDYYAKHYPDYVTGTPSILLNGKEGPRAGGGMANAEASFKLINKAITPALDEKTDITIQGSAKLNGTKVEASIDVAGISNPGDKSRLVVVLVEDTVKYTGSNGIRFHHQIVRAIPGGAAGTPIAEKAMKKSITIDLTEVKANLSKYLDKFAEDRPFPKADRPMALENLKLVVLVQNDETREVLQAAEIEVPGKPKAE